MKDMCIFSLDKTGGAFIMTAEAAHSPAAGEKIMIISHPSPEVLQVDFDKNPSTPEILAWVSLFQAEMNERVREIVLDTTRIPLLTSLMIGVVMRFYRIAQEKGAILRMQIANADTLRVLESFNLTDLFSAEIVSRP